MRHATEPKKNAVKFGLGGGTFGDKTVFWGPNPLISAYMYSPFLVVIAPPHQIVAGSIDIKGRKKLLAPRN